MSEAARRRYSTALGYLLAQCVPPLKLPDPQPTAYSYNGVVLPKLPEDEHPFKVIARTVRGTYRLYVFDAEEPLIVEYNTNGTLWNMSLTPANGQSYDAQDSEWVLNEDSQGTIIVAMFLGGQPRSEMVWSNYDIVYQDTIDGTDIVAGGLYFAGSEPVPVYE